MHRPPSTLTGPSLKVRQLTTDDVARLQRDVRYLMDAAKSSTALPGILVAAIATIPISCVALTTTTESTSTEPAPTEDRTTRTGRMPHTRPPRWRIHTTSPPTRARSTAIPPTARATCWWEYSSTTGSPCSYSTAAISTDANDANDATVGGGSWCGARPSNGARRQTRRCCNPASLPRRRS
jgi:hypothetical protein